jgi:predicted GIY-YIG superfamily endonuclease
MTNFFVYRHFNKDDNLLYVGMSTDPQRRLKEHASRSHWYDEIANMTVSKRKYKSFMDALSAETKAIRTEKPKYNKTWNFDRTKLERYVSGGENDCNVRLALDTAILAIGSKSKLAKDAGVSVQFMCDVVKGNRCISEKLAEYLGFEKKDIDLPFSAKPKAMPFMQFQDI